MSPRARKTSSKPATVRAAKSSIPRNVPVVELPALPALVTKADFGAWYGIAPRQMARLVDLGLPCHGRGNERRYVPMPDGWVWYRAYRDRMGKNTAEKHLGPVEEARLRKETAQAALEELKLAREQGATMRVADGERVIAAAFARVRAKLLGLAPRAAAASYGGTSVIECQAKIAPLIEEIMAELYAAADEPDEPDLPDDDELEDDGEDDSDGEDDTASDDEESLYGDGD